MFQYLLLSSLENSISSMINVVHFCSCKSVLQGSFWFSLYIGSKTVVCSVLIDPIQQ